MDGPKLGKVEGYFVGWLVVGFLLGDAVGIFEGALPVGWIEGLVVGNEIVGLDVGKNEGRVLGLEVGSLLGSIAKKRYQDQANHVSRRAFVFFNPSPSPMFCLYNYVQHIPPYFGEEMQYRYLVRKYSLKFSSENLIHIKKNIILYCIIHTTSSFIPHP